MDNNEQNDYLWYMRDKEGVKGPFTIGMIHRFILVGRLKMDTEISRDKHDWSLVKNTPAVIPQEMKHVRTEQDHERLLQAQLREDERSKDRRREKLDKFKGRRNKTDRRQSEGVIPRSHRKTREKILNQKSPSAPNIIPVIFIVGFITALVVAGVYLYFQTDKHPVRQTDCNAPPEKEVNWNNCQMEGRQLIEAALENSKLRNTNMLGANLSSAKLAGADLTYANLSIVSLAKADLKKAVLKGANLRGADLTNATFAGADLSYADLRGAQIKGVDFTGADLSRTIWIDGYECKAGSTGICK
ncbi:MAG: pentapeptide repeat-containing protein [Gammaproteobacteria bacterium]|nr:pentapeptide repeat-containing protein [Gammaproteobacteria bacterium]